MHKRESHDVRSGDARRSGEALTLDTLRAARNLDLDRHLLQVVLEADAELIDRLVRSEEVLVPQSEEGARALLLVRLGRALGDVFGSLERTRQWLETFSPELAARPRDLLGIRNGVERVLAYMETRSTDYAW